jgi:hypothetical protein
MSKIQTASKPASKPAVKAVPPPSTNGEAKTAKGKAKTEGKAKPAPFERARGRIVRGFAAVTRAAGYVEALSGKLPKEHAHAEGIKEAAEGLVEAKQWLNIIISKLNAVPSSVEFPNVKAARGSRVGASIAAGTQVVLKDKKAELYEGLFEEGEANVLEVHSVVAGGKRIVCKTSKGIRQVIPAAHLKALKSATETAEAAE